MPQLRVLNSPPPQQEAELDKPNRNLQSRGSAAYKSNGALKQVVVWFGFGLRRDARGAGYVAMLIAGSGTGLWGSKL